MAKKRNQKKAVKGKTGRAKGSQAKTVIKASAKVSGELMVLDQTPFLKKALARCKRIQRDLAARQKRLDAFEESDIPAYQSWMATEFGALLTHIREDQDALHRLESWLHEIEFAIYIMGVPKTQVYEYVRQHRENPDYWDPRYDPDPKKVKMANEPQNDPFDDMEDDERHAFEAFMKNMAEGFFGIDAEELEKEPSFTGWSPGKRKATPAQEQAAAKKTDAVEIKQLYRRLARRLHPDVSQSDSEVNRRRWEHLQAAYEAEDLEKLRALEAVCDADETGLSMQIGLAALNIWADYHDRLLKPLQAAMRDAKKHPAWGFSALDKAKREWQKKLIHHDLQLSATMLHRERESLEKLLESYRIKAEEAAAKKAAKKAAKPASRPKKEHPTKPVSTAPKQPTPTARPPEPPTPDNQSEFAF